MPELDAFNAMMLANDYAQATGEVLLTVLTGYLLITYFVGANLSVFQVSFVNSVFILTYISTWSTLAQYLETANHFRDILISQNSQIPLTSYGGEIVSSPAFNWAVACLLTAGSLYFMWSVRHPKAE